MSTYFVFYTKRDMNGVSDNTILVDSESSGKALYDDVVKAIRNYWKSIAGDVGMPAPMVMYTVKNIVCLDNVPGTQMPEENPLRVTNPTRPDLEISLDVSGIYNDRMNVVVKSKDTDETRSMCFELPADPRM